MNDEGKDDDFKLLRGFADSQTDRQMNKWTFVNVELLSCLKKLELQINYARRFPLYFNRTKLQETALNFKKIS